MPESEENLKEFPNPEEGKNFEKSGGVIASPKHAVS